MYAHSIQFLMMLRCMLFPRRVRTSGLSSRMAAPPTLLTLIQGTHRPVRESIFRNLHETDYYNLTDVFGLRFGRVDHGPSIRDGGAFDMYFNPIQPCDETLRPPWNDRCRTRLVGNYPPRQVRPCQGMDYYPTYNSQQNPTLNFLPPRTARHGVWPARTHRVPHGGFHRVCQSCKTSERNGPQRITINESMRSALDRRPLLTINLCKYHCDNPPQRGPGHLDPYRARCVCVDLCHQRTWACRDCMSRFINHMLIPRAQAFRNELLHTHRRVTKVRRTRIVQLLPPDYNRDPRVLPICPIAGCSRDSSTRTTTGLWMCLGCCGILERHGYQAGKCLL